MIRVRKSQAAPKSLTTSKAYDGEDVKKQLLQDQFGKCYVCEKECITDFEVEHYKSEKHYPNLRQNWDNLLLACGYCNRKKSDNFDNLLNPVQDSIESEIEQTIDYVHKKAVFVPQNTDTSHLKAVRLLETVFNGTHHSRKIKEEQFFEYFLGVMNRFQESVCDYLISPNAANFEAVRDELSINKEFLGFKYWIIKSNPTLEAAFGKDIIWNK